VEIYKKNLDEESIEEKQNIYSKII